MIEAYPLTPEASGHAHETAGKPAVTGLGGGGGLRAIATAMRPHVGKKFTGVVSVFDSGGSTGDIRAEYGGIALGDIRNVSEALSKWEPDVLNGLSEKFGPGTGESSLNVENHAAGNLILARLHMQHPNDPERVIDAYTKLFRIKGHVLPITNESRHLRLTPPGEEELLLGEHEIDDTQIPNLKGSLLELDQKARVANAAARAIRSSNLIVTGLGDLYTSVGPNVLVDGVTELLEEKPVIWVMNLMNSPRQTRGFTALDFLQEFKRLNGGTEVVNRVIYNTTPLNEGALQKQMEEGSEPVAVNEEELRDHGYDVVGYPLASDIPVTRDPFDRVKYRAPIVHDAPRLGNAIMREWYQNHFGFKEK